jgi:membrane associated rhomboid family serine protease
VLNPPPAIATQVLVATNVLVYLALGAYLVSRGVSFNDFLNGDIRVPVAELGGRLMPWLPGALVPLTFFGLHEWWQILTYNFVHGNLMHIGMNMYCLFTLGNVMEGRWGRGRFLILYFGSGLIAGVAVLLSSANPAQGTVGASGAIAGLLTSLGVWAWMNRRYLPPQFVEAHFRVVGLNLLILIGSGFMIPNISMSAHVGGAIGGAILSVPLAWLGPTLPLRHRVMGVAALIAIAVVCVIALEFSARPEVQVRQPQMKGIRHF